jgi:hypothetical protein
VGHSHFWSFDGAFGKCNCHTACSHGSQDWNNLESRTVIKSLSTTNGSMIDTRHISSPKRPSIGVFENGSVMLDSLDSPTRAPHQARAPLQGSIGGQQCSRRNTSLITHQSAERLINGRSIAFIIFRQSPPCPDHYSAVPVLSMLLTPDHLYIQTRCLIFPPCIKRLPKTCCLGRYCKNIFL